MRQTFYILFLLITLALSANAQKLTVESFKASPSDISALSYERLDINGVRCALVKIQFVGEIHKVENNVIGELLHRTNETWAYVTRRTRQIKVVPKDYLPLMVTFEEFGIDKLESGMTYELVLVKPQGAQSADNILQTLTINYLPKNASVLIDNEIVESRNGMCWKQLPVGPHSYIVTASGYESEEGTVKIKASAPSRLQIELTPKAGISSQNNTPQWTEEDIDSVEVDSVAYDEVVADTAAMDSAVVDDYENIETLRQLANSGDAVAQYRYGDKFFDGDGVEQSYSEALRWFRKSAAQGYELAQNDIGYCYAAGVGVEASYTEAFKWYLEAAKGNLPMGMYNVGYCYEFGLGVSKNMSEAVKWYKKAAALGNDKAIEVLEKKGITNF